MVNELMWWGWNFEKQQWFPCLEKEIRECVTHEGVIVCATTAHRDERKRAVIDAVLAALREAGALLPELPERFKEVSLRYEVFDGQWLAILYGVKGGYSEYHEGTAPTIPAAIANALEGTE